MPSFAGWHHHDDGDDADGNAFDGDDTEYEDKENDHHHRDVQAQLNAGHITRKDAGHMTMVVIIIHYPGTTQCMLQAQGAWQALYISLLINCRMSRGPVRFVGILTVFWF